MTKIIQALHSRTIWTLAIMFAYNVLAIYGNGLSPQLSVLVNSVLGLVAGYFKLNPSQTYTPAGVPSPAV